MIWTYFKAGASLIFCCILSYSEEQLSLAVELRTRTELRSGLETTRPVSYDEASFIFQHIRLAFHYKSSRFIILTSLQDDLVWRQDASIIVTNNLI
jgi:hypothetical protein